jgi:hypothetical protein
MSRSSRIAGLAKTRSARDRAVPNPARSAAGSRATLMPIPPPPAAALIITG